MRLRNVLSLQCALLCVSVADLQSNETARHRWDYRKPWLANRVSQVIGADPMTQELRTRIALKYGQGRGILFSREETVELYELIRDYDRLSATFPQVAEDRTR